MDNRCAARVGTGCAMGGALGASIGISDLAPDLTLTRSVNGVTASCAFAGAAYGTFEAFRYKVCRQDLCQQSLLQQLWDVQQPLTSMFALQVPGVYKIRYIGQTTLSSAAVSSNC